MLWPIHIRSYITRTDDGPDLSFFVHQAQRVAPPGKNVEITTRMNHHSTRIKQWALNGLCAVFGDSLPTVSGNGSYDTRFQINYPDAPVVQVGHIKLLTRRIQGKVKSSIEFCLVGGATVPRIAGFTGAGDGRDDAGLQINLSDAVVARVGHVHVFVFDVQAVRVIQLRVLGGSPIPTVGLLSCPSEKRDDPSGIDLADFLPLVLADIPVALLVEIYSKRLDQFGPFSRAPERTLTTTSNALDLRRLDVSATQYDHQDRLTKHLAKSWHISPPVFGF